MKYFVQYVNKEDDGILFFFQRLEEMLFHYSRDIVRVPVHNTRSLILEYMNNESERKKGQVKEYQIEQIIDELKYSLSVDKILRKNLGDGFVNAIVENVCRQKGEVIQYLYNKFQGKVYYDWCVKYIKEHATQPSHKDEVEYGLKTWIVEIMQMGYSPEYVYNYLHEVLADNAIEARQKLTLFIEHFSCEKKQYRVYFAFTSHLEEYRDYFIKRLNVEFEDDGTFDKIRRYKNDFVGYIKINSLDWYIAMSEAYERMRVFLKYYRVLTNQKRQLVRNYGLVRETDSDQIYNLPIKPLGYHSIEEEGGVKWKYTVDNIITTCRTKNKDTYDRINKMIDLHNKAIQQQDLNDGFLNLWSILEIVCADIPGDSKIIKIVDGIVPILQKDYFDAVFRNIVEDMRDNLSKADYNNWLKEMGVFAGTAETVGNFIFLPQYEGLRDAYFKKLEQYPVIRTKIYRLWCLRNSKEELIALSRKYSKRVKWHLYRLYRARNQIVHSGDAPKEIKQLGEHLHIYVDQIIFELLAKLSSEKTLNSISDVLIDTTLSIGKTTRELKKQTSICKDEVKLLLESYFYNS